LAIRITITPLTLRCIYSFNNWIPTKNGQGKNNKQWKIT